LLPLMKRSGNFLSREVRTEKGRDGNRQRPKREEVVPYFSKNARCTTAGAQRKRPKSAIQTTVCRNTSNGIHPHLHRKEGGRTHTPQNNEQHDAVFSHEQKKVGTWREEIGLCGEGRKRGRGQSCSQKSEFGGGDLYKTLRRGLGLNSEESKILAI